MKSLIISTFPESGIIFPEWIAINKSGNVPESAMLNVKWMKADLHPFLVPVQKHAAKGASFIHIPSSYSIY